MKIIHIITGLGNGGAEGTLYRLVLLDQEISANQHIVISLMDGGIYADRLKQATIRVECLNMPRGRITLRGLKRLYSFIRDIKPDLVQTWMYHSDLLGGIVAKLAGVKTVCWGIRHANFDKDKNKKKSIFIIKLCALLSSHLPTQIICCSQKAASLHRHIGFNAHKICIIPNGYALNQFMPDKSLRDKIRTEFQIDGNTITYGMVARFDPQKDHYNLIQALYTLKRDIGHFTCILVGPDITPENSILVSWIESHNLSENIILLGPRNDVPSIMNMIDLHVLSSLGEAFPNVVAEAMACGTPCVTTDVGDAALIVGNTGWVVPSKDPESLAEALAIADRERRSDPSTWAKRQDGCRNRIKNNFELKKMVLLYNEAWRMAIGQAKQSISSK